MKWRLTLLEMVRYLKIISVIALFVLQTKPKLYCIRLRHQKQNKNTELYYGLKE